MKYHFDSSASKIPGLFQSQFQLIVMRHLQGFTSEKLRLCWPKLVHSYLIDIIIYLINIVWLFIKLKRLFIEGLF